MPASSVAARTPEVIHLYPVDNVCVAVQTLTAGQSLTVGGRTFAVEGLVKMGHKLAVAPIAKGAPIVKYGETIGFAAEAIEPGQWVHTHNVLAPLFERQYEYCTEIPPEPTPITDRTFQGYRRADGRAGTRNYIAIISNVNCSASVSKYIAAPRCCSDSIVFPY
ncbi:MAG: UxaA family hydrolase [Pirellulales bacterium]